MRYTAAVWMLALVMLLAIAGCQRQAAREAARSERSTENAVAAVESRDPANEDSLAVETEELAEAAGEASESADEAYDSPVPSTPPLSTAAPARDANRHLAYAPLAGRASGAAPGPADQQFGFRIAPAAEGDALDGLADARPGEGGDKFARIYENNFKQVKTDPLSTFSIDVDTASYSRVRSYLLEYGQLPPPDAVRIEELVNYFPYDYAGPMGREHPFVAHMEVAECPWSPEHRLARIAIKGQEIEQEERPASNLVFLIDVSGSMNEVNRLPLVLKGLTMLAGQLNENDRVAMVVYAGAAGLVLPSTPGNEHKTIIDALSALHAGGSTNGGEGLALAYKTAEENFITAGTNRVILCTDGDFNVGVTSTGEIVRMAEEFAKKNIFLSVLGFGTGNLNDAMMEELSGKANGNYAYIDTESEAKKVLVEQMAGTLVTIAKDVKIQIEFNPAKVASYRLIGYENRILAAEDFNDDKKDAGEIGAGHTVTALYEIVPASAKEKLETPKVDDLKYQEDRALTEAAESDELLTLKLRYKHPEGDVSTLMSEPVKDDTQKFSAASKDFKFAAAVASFGMLLRGSVYKGDTNYDAVLEIATDGATGDKTGYRTEFLEIVKTAKELAK